MRTMPKVSVILPSLNVVSYICQCVESVVGQSLRDIEIICVDAGSTDGTLEVLREFEARDKRIKVLIADRKSYGLQMNMGLDAATGEYVGIVETDDWVPANMYSELYKLAKKNDLDFVKADFYRFTVNEDGTLNKDYNKLSSDDSYYGRVLTPGEEPETFKFIMNTWSGIYRTDFLRRWNIRHNETPGASYQDNGFWFQTFMRAERAYFLHRPFYMNRRDNPNSSVFSKTKVYAMRDEYDFIRSIIDADPTLQEFIPICNYFRFCGYYYNTINRILPELRSKFLDEFSREFHELAEKNELDRSLFSHSEWSDLMEIVFLPEAYLQKTLRAARPFSFRETYREYRPVEQGAPAVSVIIPVYNSQAYLRECLDSVCGQSCADIEIICVNDGSTDSSREIIAEYCARDARIKVIDQENGGPSRARNAGLEAACGRYVCLVDSDDGLDPGTLKKLVSVADKRHTDVVVFGMDIDHYPIEGERPDWIDDKSPVRNALFETCSASVLFDEPGARPFVQRDFFRRSFLAENDLWFSEYNRFGEDAIFQFAAFPKAHNIVFLKDKFCHYRCSHAGSLMAKAQSLQARKASSHVDIVAHVASIINAEGHLEEMRIQFAEWAIDFFYSEFEKCDEPDMPAAAEKFLPVLEMILSESQRYKLGEGRRERLRAIRATLAGREADEEGAEPDYSDWLPVRHERVETPRVSIVVPAHNSELTIRRTLHSLLCQTMDEIEVICFDDASTDATRSVLDACAALDGRLVTVGYETNRTASQARKDGVLMARGDYILFCDADDTVEPTACEDLVREMERDPVDILQFGTNVICEDAAREDRMWMLSNTLPFLGTLRGGDVFDGCFRGKLYRFNLWNKIYSAAVAKQAFAHVEDGAFPRGQDVYAFTLLAYYARSYRGIQAKYYDYHLGSGMDGKKTLSVDQFERFCGFAKVSDALRRFFEGEGVFDTYADVWFEMRSNLVGDCINKWHKKVSDQDKGRAFDLMLDHWPAWLVTEGVARRYWNSQDECVTALASSRTRSVTCENPRVVGMYYHRQNVGGVEEVMKMLEPVWVSMGYRVVVITDVQGPEDHVDLPQGVTHRVVPNLGTGNPYMVKTRTKAFTDIVREEGIDLLVDHAWNTALLQWDMLSLKSVGVPVVVHCHNIFSQRLLAGGSYFGKMPYVMGYADGVVCLSEADVAFWGKFNPNVQLVWNPVNWDTPLACRGSEDREPRSILWIARFSNEKRPWDALGILAKVRESMPDVKLYMLGKSDTGDMEVSLEQYAEQLDVTDSVEFCGYLDDISDYLKRGAVFLSTSEHEGFGLSIIESLGAGVPVVMYDMPYLALVQDNDGIISVRQEDQAAAASAITELLTDGDAYSHASEGALAYTDKVRDYDYVAAWTRIFSSLAQPRPDNGLSEADKTMWGTLLRHYSVGAEKSSRRAGGRGAAVMDWDEVDRIRSSATYKIGRFATWPARKIRTFLNCLSEHGFEYTKDVYLHRK